MKHRFDWCDATCEWVHEGLPYAFARLKCANTTTNYTMSWLPQFCPVCGGKLTKEAKARYGGGR